LRAHCSVTPEPLPMDYAEALAVLDLKPGATAAEIEAAYKAAVRAWHPDRFSSADT
jgi:curved DNA-binding protein CbpA